MKYKIPVFFAVRRETGVLLIITDVMTKKELEKLIREAVEDYIIDEDTYDDNAQLCIEPAEMNVYVADSRDVDPDSDKIDCYDVMDFVEMDTNPDSEGKWRVDDEAVSSAAAEYFPE